MIRTDAAMTLLTTVLLTVAIAFAQQTDTPAITLQDVPFSSGAKLTIERRGQIVLFGINRPYRTALILTLSKNWPRIFPI